MPVYPWTSVGVALPPDGSEIWARLIDPSAPPFRALYDSASGSWTSYYTGATFITAQMSRWREPTNASPGGSPAGPTDAIQFNDAGAFGGGFATLDTAGNAVFLTIAGDGSAITGIPAANPFDQTLNRGDIVLFQDVEIPGIPYDGESVLNSIVQIQIDITNCITYGRIGIDVLAPSGDGSALTGIPTTTDISGLQAQIDAINLILATGISGTSTPATGTVEATNGIVTAVT